MNWIKVNDVLPQAGVPVLVFVQKVYGDKTRRLRAFYAPSKTIEDSDDNSATEYDDEIDLFYLKQGWYECNEFEPINWRIDGEVTHWMPLPEEPKV